MPFRAMLVLVAALALAVGVVSASGRPHSAVTGADPAGDVQATGLTAAEQAAIDLLSVRAVGKEGLGVVVTATFRGNFSALIGRGHLAGAAAVLVLRGKTAVTSGLVTLGPGKLGKTFRRTRATQVGVVRHGKQVTFFVRGPGYGNVGAVNVEVLLNSPPLGARTTAGRAVYFPPHIGDDAWTKLLAQPGADTVTVSDPRPLTLSGPEFSTLLVFLEAQIGYLEALEEEYGPSEGLYDELDFLYGLEFQVRVLRFATGNSLTGAVTVQSGALSILIRNGGVAGFDALRILLGSGVHHTGARLTAGATGRCGPGEGPSDVFCLLDKPLAPGASATVQITTDKQYPQGGTVQVSAREAGASAFKGPFVVGGSPPPCTCVDISAAVSGFAHGHVTSPQGPVSLKLFMNWTLSCTNGSGTCAGEIKVVPSGDLKLIGPPGGKVECNGAPNCPERTKGRFTVSMTSVRDLHETPRDVPITLKFYCRSGKSLVETRSAKLLLHFDANGFLNKKASDLKG